MISFHAWHDLFSGMKVLLIHHTGPIPCGCLRCVSSLRDPQRSPQPFHCAFVLGLRHGLDADHLAAIDGLTRCNASASRRFAPFCGVLFSGGARGCDLRDGRHAGAGRRSDGDPPEWLAVTGTVISAVTLLLLGSMNLHAAACIDARS